MARALEEADQWSALEPRALMFGARAQAAPAAKVLEASEANTFGSDRLEALRATSLGALLERQPEQAILSLGAVWEQPLREGVEDPRAFPVAGALVEALVRVGQVRARERGDQRLGWLASEQQHPWGLDTLKRLRAVVKLAGGHDDAAVAEIAQAVGAYRTLGSEVDSARAPWFPGRIQQRAKKRAAAESCSSGLDRRSSGSTARLGSRRRAPISAG